MGGRFGLNAKAASELTKLPQRKLAVVLKNVLKNAGSEGVQEYLQNVYSEIALDTPLEDALSSSLRSGAVGAVLGGFAGGGLASIKRRVDKVDEDGIEQASEYFDPNDVANVINPQKGSAQERGLEIIKGNLSINDVGGSAAKDIEVATAIDLGKEQLTVILNRDTSTDAQKKRVRSTFDFLDQIRDYAPIYEYINTTKPTGDSLGEYNSSTASTVDYNTFTQEDVNGLLVRNSEAIRGRIENINNANKFEIAGATSISFAAEPPTSFILKFPFIISKPLSCALPFCGLITFATSFGSKYSLACSIPSSSTLSTLLLIDANPPPAKPPRTAPTAPDLKLLDNASSSGVSSAISE